jgi:hypothetical protein
VYMQQLVRVVHSIPTRPDEIQLKRITRSNFRVYTLVPADDGHLSNPKHVDMLVAE